MPDIYWSTDPPPMQVVQLIEDTAGNKWYAKFEPGCTAPMRTWTEKEYMDVMITVPDPTTIMDLEKALSQSKSFYLQISKVYPGMWRISDAHGRDFHADTLEKAVKKIIAQFRKDRGE